MTRQERASHAIQMAFKHWSKEPKLKLMDDELLHKEIVAQIEEAEREAVKACATFHCESCHQDQDEFGFPPDECSPGCCCDVLRTIKKEKAKGYAEGFRAAVEKAKGIAKEIMDPISKRKGDYIAQRIGEMEP